MTIFSENIYMNTYLFSLYSLLKEQIHIEIITMLEKILKNELIF